MQNKKGNTPLHEAVLHGKYHVAVKLLERAKEVTWKTPETIIKYNEYADDVVSINDVLLIIGNDDGNTPLHIAVTVRHLGLVYTLISCAQLMKGELTTNYTKVLIVIFG